MHCNYGDRGIRAWWGNGTTCEREPRFRQICLRFETDARAQDGEDHVEFRARD